MKFETFRRSITKVPQTKIPSGETVLKVPVLPDTVTPRAIPPPTSENRGDAEPLVAPPPDNPVALPNNSPSRPLRRRAPAPRNAAKDTREPMDPSSAKNVPAKNQSEGEQASPVKHPANEPNPAYKYAPMTNQSEDRTLPEYLHIFGQTVEELRGGVVLDVGSGIHLSFGKQAAKEGIKVISLNPALTQPIIRRATKTDQDSGSSRTHPFRRKQQVPAVAGTAQQLPVQEGSVRVIEDLLAASTYLPSDPLAYDLYFHELDRVLEPGGQINIYCWPDPNQKRFLDEQVTKMKEKGYATKETTKNVEGEAGHLFKLVKPKPEKAPVSASVSSDE